ncbi:MAG: hypothetical protein IIB55_07650 [Planctomycetes bacterium]|nr:hypothetical protein [Planctomycetota bacterium]
MMLNFDWLTEHREETRVALERTRAIERRWSWGRIGTFALVVGVWFPSSVSVTVASFLCVVAIALFALCVHDHRRARGRRISAEHRLAICDESLSRCGGQIVLVRDCVRPPPAADRAAIDPIIDDGETWPLTVQEIEDFDLYAPPVGLFGLLNRTSSVVGARRLAHMLEHPCLDAERILSRQQSVRRLAEDSVGRIAIMAGAIPLRSAHADLDAVASAIRQAEPLADALMPVPARMWGALSGLFFVVSVAQWARGVDGWGWPLVALLFFNALIFLRMHGALRRAITPWQNLGPALGGWEAAARAGCAHLAGGAGDGVGSSFVESADAGRSRRLKPAARGRKEGSDDALRTLGDAFAKITAPSVLPAIHGLIGWSEAGGMLHAVCNIVFFYDLHVADALMRRVCPARENLLRGLAALAELDALCGLACFAWEQPVSTYPQPVAERLLDIRGGRHPLIPPDDVVSNDILLGEQAHVWIVTGSNMAGKSTLLRMAGASSLLAQMGTAVTAEAMRFSPARLVSDLSVHDNLAKHESYFLAEVRHLKRMVAPPDGEHPILGLIDEPFRGTNSQEQVAAALAVTQHLIRSPGLFLVATHEHRLTELGDDTSESAPARNRHFRENLEAGGMIFDYKLHPGPAQTRNALRVLEKEEYPATILAAARKWLDDSRR